MTRGAGPNDAFAGIPGRLWRLIELATNRRLATDYDGTLAPFRVDRAAATPDPEVLAALRRVVGAPGTEVVVVSGRPLEDLERFLPGLAVRLVGEHGWEERTPAGERRQHPLPAHAHEALASARRQAGELAGSDRLEVKRTALVLHVRGLEPDRAARLVGDVRRAWLPFQAEGVLRLDGIDGGLELRAREMDKGRAVRRLVAQGPRGMLTVFVGDDVTDEDGFEAAADSGFGIRVGPSDRPTQAAGQLPDLPAVAAFFDEWCRLAHEGSGA